MIKYKLFAGLITFSLASGLLFSQDTLLTRDMDEVTVVATRLPSSIWETARSVHKEDLTQTNRGNQNLALDESLMYIPGVFALNPLNFSQDIRLAMRGFGSRAAFGVRGVKVWVDGIPATTPDGQTQLDHLDMQQMSSMEILNGASAGLYGNASGGMINLSSGEPSENRFKLGFKGGSFGYLRPYLDVTRLWGDLALESSVSYVQTDGYRDHSDMQGVNLRTRLTRDLREGKISLLLNYVNSPTANDPGGVNMDQVETDRSSARDQNILYDAGETISRAMAAFIFEHELSANQKIEAKAYYIYRDFENLLPFQDGGAVALDRNFFGLQTKYQLEENRYRLLAGIDLESQSDARMRYDNLQGEIGPLVFDQQEVFGNAAAYLLQEFTLNNRFKLEVTSRFDLIRVKAVDQFLTDGDQSGIINWQHFSPSAGINYRFMPGGYFFGRYSHSFETPALSELSNIPGGEGGFNQDLKPQQANHYEMGTKGRSGSWKYTLSLFHIDLSQELIPFELEGFPGRTFYRNAGKSKRSGIEVSAANQITPSLAVRGAYTFSDFRYTEFEIDGSDLDGNKLPGIPQHFGSLGLLYNHAMGLYGSMDARYTGQIWVNDANSLEDDSYLLLHTRVGWEFTWTGAIWDAYLGVRNITGTLYNDNIRINAFGGRYFEPAPKQQFFFGVEVTL